VYIGAAVGQADVRSEDHDFSAAHDFNEESLCWKAFVGVRPLAFLGAEVAYMDLGNAHRGRVDSVYPGGYLYTAVNAKQTATSVFGVIYLPEGLMDLYGKVGLARLHSEGSQVAEAQGLPAATLSFHQDEWTTAPAYGLGWQLRFGALAARLEYERVATTGPQPDFVSIGATWNF